VIKHTRADGTLIYGSVKGDGVYEVLRDLRCGWRWMPSIGMIGLQQSRYKASKQDPIERAVQALTEAGYEVQVDLDDVTLPGSSFAEQEAHRADHAEQRAERYADYTAGAAARSEAAYLRYRQHADHWPLGQPLISDSARAAHRRMLNAHDAAMGEHGKARYWAGRERAAEDHRRHRYALPTILRRIQRLEEERRRLLRRLDGRKQSVFGEATAASQSDVDRWTADLIQLDGEIGYWRELVAEKEKSGQKVWSKDDFKPGDFVRVHDTWYEIVRVNPKSLTVPCLIDGVNRGIYTVNDARRRWPEKIPTDTVPYDKVQGRATAQNIQEAISRAETSE
jgi:hypothetical protein